MTTTPPEAPPDPTSAPEPGPYDGGPRATREEVRDLGRLRRTSGSEKRIAGVAGGLARHLDIDPLILRVALVVLVFFGGAGLIVYGACWLLVPADDRASAPVHLDERSRTVALVVVGVIAGLALLGDSLGQLGFPWPLAIIALITLVVLSTIDRRRDRPRPTAPAVPHQHVPETGTFQPIGPTPATAWAPVAPTTTWAPPPRLPNPRRRGPILFWFTLALLALGIGVLGIVDVAGVAVAESAYPALVLATCAVMLLVGAVYGRAGGLILLGLLAALATAGTTAAEGFDESNVLRPATAADVRERYEIGAGELTLDLTGVSDLDALDGRTIDVEGGMAAIVVLLPEGIDAEVEARIGLGEAKLFGDVQEGGGIETSNSHDGGNDVPEITLDLQLGVGEIDVHTQPSGDPSATGASR